MNQEEWDTIVDVIKAIVPDGEADCYGLPEELISALQRRLKEGMKMVNVTNLYMKCSYTEKGGAIAFSDCCQKPATTAVEAPLGHNVYWRCPEHEGQFKPGIVGRVHHEVAWKEQQSLRHTLGTERGN